MPVLPQPLGSLFFLSEDIIREIADVLIIVGFVHQQEGICGKPHSATLFRSVVVKTIGQDRQLGFTPPGETTTS